MPRAKRCLATFLVAMARLESEQVPYKSIKRLLK
jgi:hypothetical protein